MSEETPAVEAPVVANPEQMEGFCADFQITVRNGRISFNTSFTNRRLTHAEVAILLKTVLDGLVVEGLNTVPKDKLCEVVNLQALTALSSTAYVEPVKTPEETPSPPEETPSETPPDSAN